MADYLVQVSPSWKRGRVLVQTLAEGYVIVCHADDEQAIRRDLARCAQTGEAGPRWWRERPAHASAG